MGERSCFFVLPRRQLKRLTVRVPYHNGAELEKKILPFAWNEEHARAIFLRKNPHNVRPFVDQQ